MYELRAQAANLCQILLFLFTYHRGFFQAISPETNVSESTPKRTFSWRLLLIIRIIALI